MLFYSSIENPLGLNPGPAEKVRVKMRGSAGTAGQAVYFDLAAGDAAVTAATTFGAAGNPTSNVLAATNSHDGYQTTTVYFYGILAEAIADDAEGWCYIRGFVQAQSDGGSAAAGVGLTPVASSYLGAISDGRRCCAVSAEGLGSTAAALKYVFFDGINGFNKTHDVAS